MESFNVYEQMILNGGGIVAVCLILVILFKKVHTMFSSETLTSTSNNSQTNLIGDLNNEIARLRKDFDELREIHKKEISEIKQDQEKERNHCAEQISLIEKKLTFLKQRNESMRNDALEAYAYIRTNEDVYGATYSEELKARLMKIIVQDNSAVYDNGNS